jgi:hypothetical protein
MTRRFSDWVDVEGLTAGERDRLERVHDMLVAAGPPADLPTDLEGPPAQVIPFPTLRRRPVILALVAAAAVAVASFTGGYFANGGGGMHVTQVVAFQGAQNQLASLHVGTADAVGNDPMVLTVSGLPQLKHGYYELFTMRNGKPSFPCTGFKMVGSTTSVRFSVPYVLDPGTKLMITVVQHAKNPWPGRAVMHSV